MSCRGELSISTYTLGALKRIIERVYNARPAGYFVNEQWRTNFSKVYLFIVDSPKYGVEQ